MIHFARRGWGHHYQYAKQNNLPARFMGPPPWLIMQAWGGVTHDKFFQPTYQHTVKILGLPDGWSSPDPA